MLRLRLWLAIYTFWLLLFYNIERFDETINIASFIYLLIPFSVVLILLFPRLLIGKRSGSAFERIFNTTLINVAVNAVIAGVGFSAGKPPIKRWPGFIQYLLPGLAPDQ